jgi:hypothetical protein
MIIFVANVSIYSLVHQRTHLRQICSFLPETPTIPGDTVIKCSLKLRIVWNSQRSPLPTVSIMNGSIGCQPHNCYQKKSVTTGFNHVVVSRYERLPRPTFVWYHKMLTSSPLFLEDGDEVTSVESTLVHNYKEIMLMLKSQSMQAVRHLRYTHVHHYQDIQGLCYRVHEWEDDHQ